MQTSTSEPWHKVGEDNAFWDSSTSGQPQAAAAKRLSLDGQRYDAAETALQERTGSFPFQHPAPILSCHDSPQTREHDSAVTEDWSAGIGSFSARPHNLEDILDTLQASA